MINRTLCSRNNNGLSDKVEGSVVLKKGNANKKVKQREKNKGKKYTYSIESMTILSDGWEAKGQ